jgi:hypothetical protein
MYGMIFVNPNEHSPFVSGKLVERIAAQIGSYFYHVSAVEEREIH